jgi:hypothetical protein
MIEARITLANSVTSPIRIPDLGLILRLGEVRWADEKRVRKSICVEALISAGKIRVSYERRNKKPMSNPTPKPSIHAVTMTRPSQRVLSAVPVHAAPAVDVEKLAAAVASAMAAQVQPQPAQPDAALLASMIERAVESAMAKVSITVAGTGVATTTTTVTHGPDEPVYIPSNIVGDKTVDIKTTAGVSDASGLDDAARALKSVNRPKRVRKQDNGEE